MIKLNVIPDVQKFIFNSILLGPNNNENKKNPLYLHYILIPLILFATTGIAKEYQFTHTVEDYINYALAHNPALHSADHMIEMTKEQRKVSTAIPDPSISLEYMDKMISEKGVTVAKVSISQKIPWFRKLSAKRTVVEKTVMKLDHTKSNIKIQLVYNVREAYVSLYAVGQKIFYMKRSLDLLKQMESVMLSAYAAAVGSQSALLKLQVKMALAENKILSLEEEGRIIRYILEELLNTKAALQFPYPEELPKLKVVTDISEIKNSALMNNTNVLIQKGSVEEAKANVTAAAQIYSPDFSVSASYTSPKFTGTKFVNFGELGEWSAMLSLSLPVWHKNNRAKVNEAKQHLASEEEKLVKEELSAVRGGMVHHVKLEDMERQIKLFQNVLIPKAKQTVILLQEKYTIQKGSVLDFLDAEKILMDLEMELVDMEKKRELYAAEIIIRSIGRYK